MESDAPLEQQLDLILADTDLSPHSKGRKLLDLGLQLVAEFRKTRDMAKLQLAIDCLDHSLKMTPNGGTSVRNNLAIALYLRFQELQDLTDFERSLNLHEDALHFFDDEDETNVSGEQHPGYVDKGITLNYIANRLEKRFDMTGQEEFLFSAIKLHEESLLLHPAGHKLRARSLDNLADALYKKFDVFGHKDDQDSAINLHMEALELEPSGDEGRIVTLNQLGSKLRARYEKFGNDIDLDSAIDYLKECLSLLSQNHTHRKATLGNLAAALMRRFQKNHNLQDSSESIALLGESLSYAPPGHPIRRPLLLNMAATLTLRFNFCADKQDLDRAIELYEEALSSPSLDQRDRVVSLHDLANRLVTRYKKFGDMDDVNRAVKYDIEALNCCPTGHSRRAYSLGKLAETLSVRFHAIGQVEDLNGGIILHNEALSILPLGHPDREELLHSLSIEYALRFEALGKEEDLNMAISKVEEVLVLRPEGHQSRGRSLSVLGRLLSLRFDLLGYREDLDNAVKVTFESLALHPNGDSDREASLTNLANALTTRYELFMDTQNLDIAILLHEEALSLQPPGHWNRRISLNNLAGCLSQRFSISGNTDDLEAALKLQEEALQIERGQHQMSTFNYARMLVEKYKIFHDAKDLELAISTYEEALLTSFKDSPFRSQCMLSLAFALITRFENFENHDSVEINNIIKLFEELSSSTTQFGISFRGSQTWANFASRHNHPSVAQAYRAAIDLLPFMVPMTFDVSSRTRNLLHVDYGFVADAAAHAIHHIISCDEAIELLESGRSVFWSQAMKSSPDLRRLYLVAPETARNLQSYSDELTKSEKVADGYIPMSSMSTRSVSSLKVLQDNWLRTIEQVRSIRGFEEFLRPLGIHRLKEAKSQGIIVILNTTASSCDALIMTPQEDNIIHVPLSDVNSVILNGVAELLKAVVGSKRKHSANINIKIDDSLGKLVSLGLPFKLPRYGKLSGSSSTEASLTFLLPVVLNLLWERIVSPIVSALNLKKSSKLPRLWWCPTGPLTFLPLHAASSYPNGSLDTFPNESISEYVISSYTSTITALVGDTETNQTEFKLVGIADTKNLARTEEEIRNLRKYIPSKFIIELGTSNNPPATITEVCSQMESASIVHFACHGRVDEDPLQSGLQLEDGNFLSVDKIMQLSIPNASIAFLSACETATGSDKLPDEALHIGSSLTFAGFKSVIATMWQIEDEDGPVIADIFYRNLFEHVDLYSASFTGVDFTKSAEALHNAVKEMRECGIPPHRWAPFIHIGK